MLHLVDTVRDFGTGINEKMSKVCRHRTKQLPSGCSFMILRDSKVRTVCRSSAILIYFNPNCRIWGTSSYIRQKVELLREMIKWGTPAGFSCPSNRIQWGLRLEWPGGQWWQSQRRRWSLSGAQISWYSKYQAKCCSARSAGCWGWSVSSTCAAQSHSPKSRYKTARRSCWRGPAHSKRTEAASRCTPFGKAVEYEWISGSCRWCSPRKTMRRSTATRWWGRTCSIPLWRRSSGFWNCCKSQTGCNCCQLSLSRIFWNSELTYPFSRKSKKLK